MKFITKKDKEVNSETEVELWLLQKESSVQLIACSIGRYEDSQCIMTFKDGSFFRHNGGSICGIKINYKGQIFETGSL